MTGPLPGRMAQVTRLLAGKHAPNADGDWCAMEAVAYIAGEPWSDQPQCVCPVLAAFARAWNDGMPVEMLDTLLLPLVPRFVGTAGGGALAERRAMMALDWLVREHVPARLRDAGLPALADRLAGLPPATAMVQAAGFRPTAEAVREAVDTARRAAAAAAGEAKPIDRPARMAAWDKLRDALEAADNVLWALDYVDMGDAPSVAARVTNAKDPADPEMGGLRRLLIRMIEAC